MASSENKLFHESWHRIASQKIALRTSAQIHRQMYRGQRWYVVRDPFSNQYYRLRPSAYEFVIRLNGIKTVEDVWEEVAELHAERAAGQGDIIELLAQLYHANLLHYDSASNSEIGDKLFARYKKKKQRELKGNLMSVMFLKIPLFDPTSILNKLDWLIRILFSKWGLLLWGVVAVWGLKTTAEHFGALADQTQGVLAPSNLFWLYGCMVVLKTLHEFGHAFAVRRYGGEVHTMGVMLMVFSPLPYVDASASWSFRSKWKRALVGASGMLVEVFIASIALLVWANTGTGLVNTLAYNMIFIASVSTVLFNINPLLRFDGYYILSDILDIPNLHKQSQAHLVYLIEKYVFGCKNATTPATTRRLVFWLTSFGILSFFYRIFVFVAITLFVADRFLIIGLLMALFSLVMWLIMPLVKLIKYLATSPKLEKRRPQAIGVTVGLVLLVLMLTNLIPFPSSFQAPGVLQSHQYVVTANKVGGSIQEVYVHSGEAVHVGTPLLRLENPELFQQIKETQGSLKEANHMYRRALQESQSDLKPLASRLEFYQKRLSHLEQQKQSLVLRSTIQGVWVAPESKHYIGMWVQKGTPLGQLVDPTSFYFASVVSQEDGAWLFDETAQGKIRKAEVKLYGQVHKTIPVKKYSGIPMEQTELPSVALGWGGGGDLAISQEGEGQQSAEPFYEVRADLENKGSTMYHGRSGKIRFELPGEPLFQQGWRRLQQMLQKRYQI